ncbi:MAG: MFS transporter [Gemmatimonadaceae bacterium]
MLQVDIGAVMESPAVRVGAGLIGVGLVVVLAREVKNIPARLFALMGTAFLDMVGVLMVIPLLPFYVQRLGGDGMYIALLGRSFNFGIGLITAIMVSAFTIAQLVSAPIWGRFSDKFGRRPALLVALAASAVAYLVFGFANSLLLLLLSRIVQGAGGGTVGVIQAYVADSVEPAQRARSLGWLSAATNLGVALGPVVGAFAVTLGDAGIARGVPQSVGHAMPGLLAAALCASAAVFAWKFLPESRAEHHPHPHGPRRTSRQALLRVISHSNEASSRLIWIYAITMGAFNGVTAVLALFLAYRFQVTEKTIGYFFMYVGAISVFTRVLLLGKAVDRFGEARLSRFGMVLLAIGLGGIPLVTTLGGLAFFVALIPLGTAFTFPCVTGLLSRVIASHERGLYMGLQQTYGGVARVVAPIWAGFAFDRLGLGVPFYTSAVVVLATISLGLGLDQYARRE